MGNKGRISVLLFPVLMVFSIFYILNQSPNPVMVSHQVYSKHYHRYNVHPSQESSSSYVTINDDYPFQLIRAINDTNSTYTSPYSVIGDKICPTGVRRLIVLVMIGPKDWETRDTIRQTWGSFKADGLTYGFLIASSEDDETMKLLQLEASIEKDLIVDSSFIDSYDNLTLKSMSMVNWASAYCPEAEAILKTDSDMWINVPRLLSNLTDLQPGLYGIVYKKVRPIRDSKNKWYVPKGQYRTAFFPNYLSGTAYLMVNKGTNLYSRLYRASLSTSYLRLEDIYLTGLVASRAKIKLNQLKGLNFFKVPFNVCNYRQLISSHRISDEEKYLYWQLLQSSSNETCNNN